MNKQSKSSPPLTAHELEACTPYERRMLTLMTGIATTVFATRADARAQAEAYADASAQVERQNAEMELQNAEAAHQIDTDRRVVLTTLNEFTGRVLARDSKLDGKAFMQALNDLGNLLLHGEGEPPSSN